MPSPHQPIRQSEGKNTMATRENPVEGPGNGNPPAPRKGTFPWLNRSQHSSCSLDKVHQHGWKPVTMHAPILVSFAIISLVIAAVIESLAQISGQTGGLSLVPTADDISPLATFGYLFLPTIVAVVYSLCWSWIDLDVKRMQPWMELSRETGATANNSLFLDYPYDFVAFVPMKAAKRRHWAVFFAGTTMMIIFWLITPMQSAIFGTGPVIVSSPASFMKSSQLMLARDQAAILDQSVLNSAFATTWLEQSYPGFVTSEYALLPFTLAKNENLPSTETNWTATTTKLWTELECWPASVARNGPKARGTFDFDNGRGCNASQIVPYSSRTGIYPYRLLYIGYQNSAWADNFLASPTCSKNSTHQFLAIWAGFVAVDETNVTGTFCETSYYKQDVSVTVSTPSFLPDDRSIIPLGPREPLLETEFNSSAFEYLLGSGVSSVEMQRDWSASHLLEQYPRLYDKGLSWPLSPMVGFAVGGEKSKPIQDYSDTTQLGKSFATAHKMLFSMAVSQVLSTNVDSNTSDGVATTVMYGVIVSRVFSAVVEGLLVLVAVSTLSLLWISSKGESKLTSDPASVGAVINIVKNSTELLGQFAGKGNLSEACLRRAFGDQRFRLHCGCQTASGLMAIGAIGTRNSVSIPHRDRSPTAGSSTGHYIPVRPVALRKEIGFTFVAVLFAIMIGLSYLKWQEQALGGLIRPSESFEVLQILESFIPTILATLIEPFWVLLNRLLCILQPFKDLWLGRRIGTGSIDAKYTSIPPQLVAWRAFRLQHFLLAAVCLIALLANVMAVGLGGLFNEMPVQPAYTSDLKLQASQRFSNESLTFLEDLLGNRVVTFHYEEHFYVTSANITTGTLLPPWITTEYFFQPFLEVGNIADNSSNVYQGRTRGFGVAPSCVPAKSLTTPPTLDLTSFKEQHAIPSSPNCTDIYQPKWLLMNQTSTPPQGPSAIEVVDTLSFTRQLNPCDKVLILAWGRTANGSDENGTVDTSFVVCYPRFQTAMFDVTVDAAGRVLETSRITEFEDNLGYPESNNHTDRITITSNHLITNSDRLWHNDTFSRDWISQMIKLQTKSVKYLDPLEPLPAPEDMIPQVEAIYKRFFALIVGLNQFVFDNSTEEPLVVGTKWTKETRIFMSDPAFIVSMTVLTLNIIVAIIFYGYAISFFLPRMPTTIGSLLAYLAPSRAVREYAPEKSMTFSFGRYVGDDGKAHVGIEMDPFVVPVELSSLRRGNTVAQQTMLGRVKTWAGVREKGDAWL